MSSTPSSHRTHPHRPYPSSTSTSTPSPSQTPTPTSTSSASAYLPSTLTSTVSSLLKRFSTEPQNVSSLAPTGPVTAVKSALGGDTLGVEGVYTPPIRRASPFQPPPLYPLTLHPCLPSSSPPLSPRRPSDPSHSTHQQLLTRALAEEIRLLIPPRLQLVEDWHLTYGLERDGVSLATLYKKCEEMRGRRRGFVVVVGDGSGGVFGAYLTDAPHPSSHYYGTGECFLWRASIIPSSSTFRSNPSASNTQDLLSSLPAPPSSDTTHMTRSTTISTSGTNGHAPTSRDTLSPPPPNGHRASTSGTSTPDRIRFKAFPYSGENDYLIFCETGFLSVGGGDGHYGLWLDDVFERGISSRCPTFGNEPLSEEGDKFWIQGVEVWCVGS
ncbi:MAG: oxidation resistance protein 1 [Caeruleum heppii]|nr:MAG: oxidation resistance protein 1 [Caeruleum heppii]